MIFSKRKTIGVFLSKQFKPFDDAFFRRLTLEAKRLDYDVFVFMTAGYFLSKNDYDIQEKQIFRFAPFEQLDGIIAVPSTYDKGGFREDVYEALRKCTHCPVVVVREESDEFHCVYTDNHAAFQPVVRHLIEDHGLTKICFQSGDTHNSEVDVRLDTFIQEMKAHGLAVPEKNVCGGTMWTNCGMQAYEAFFSDPNDIPEAVVCANDYMAMGLIRVLREKGYQVPQDVIVTGFDNVSGWCVDVPSLTTIEPDYGRMVTEAMELISRIHRGEEKKGPIRIALEGKFVKGESCGCGARPENYFRQVSEETTALLEDENDQDASMNNMSIDLGACDDLEDLHNVMISRRTHNPIVRDHYICLFGDRDSLLEESCEKACLVHAVRDHQDGGMPMIVFDRKKLLPLMAERPEEAQVFYVKLLHQKRHNFGYSVFQYDEGKVPSRCFVQTNVLLSVALENFYRRRELLSLYEERRISSITDMMTGLLNRRGLVERLEPEWKGMVGRSIAFVCIDMDRLKKINDTYGHAAGDFAIRLLGRAIRHVLPGDALGARIGGDEFIVFLPDVGEKEAEGFVFKLNEELLRLNQEEKRSFQVMASAGFRVIQLKDEVGIEGCIQESDKALYKIKEERHARKDFVL